ncbi:hypothetical protein CLAFUW4_12459 [Fulvia fulva]|uniref:Uncharacterized protein n=1 Tax=Passalora fulva TaxID=5499 RepID=A0A9Q8USY2_PASFU|nr:uncharacterized protein CLAFUR5_11486 [Fulvia fulva]KAK4617599.1 hypothetical protein CLAFUR4_12464 [Fulvia fulva]KAK4618519.1 hypothetical protein CLAFUR0_12475 [Fulvia fulva]UJO21339.1 hypothetical protein CLAFUR5_11486 [Fulvia fulva]WPV18165.1 hypothetical protein CLAFUW4_12459 [Fulvia fulva]WPV32762.1 hypothetical protein CLAFUW7_12466 [Fulvia fulva]
MQFNSTIATDRMHVLVESKLRNEIARKDRDLRRMLGHFDMLERVNSQKHMHLAVHSNHDSGNRLPQSAHFETSSLHVEDAALIEHEERPRHEEWPKYDKDMVVIESVEVDGDEDLATSDDGSNSDEDELPDYDDVSGSDLVRIQDENHHSPPSLVEDALNDLNKLALQPSFEENTYEVSEDD